jgi:hypothetical protein
MENLGIQAISKPLWQDFVEISQNDGDYEGSDTRFESRNEVSTQWKHHLAHMKDYVDVCQKFRLVTVFFQVIKQIALGCPCIPCAPFETSSWTKTSVDISTLWSCR